MLNNVISKNTLRLNLLIDTVLQNCYTLQKTLIFLKLYKWDSEIYFNVYTCSVMLLLLCMPGFSRDSVCEARYVSAIR
jgi:hypothetical protein